MNVARAPGRRPYGHRLAWLPCVSLVLPQVLLWHFYPVAMGSPQGLCSRQHRVEGLVWEQQVTVGGGGLGTLSEWRLPPGKDYVCLLDAMPDAEALGMLHPLDGGSSFSSA